MDIFDLDASAPPPSLLHLTWAFREARVLQVAVKLRLFTVLAQRPMDANTVARQLQCDSEMTERLLMALATLALVRHDNGIWRNALPATLYLVEGQVLYLGDVIEMAAATWNWYSHLEKMVRHGRRKGESLVSKEELVSQTLWLKAMHTLALVGQAQRLARLAPLGGRRQVLDVGGAPGTLSIALIERFPALEITLFDTSEALELSKATLAQFGLAQKIMLKRGQWRQKSYGQTQFEAVLLNQLATMPAGETLKQLVKAFDALKANGVVLACLHLLDNDLNGGSEAAHYALMKDAHTIEQFCSLLEESGFERIGVLHRHAVEGDIVVGYKPEDRLPEGPDSEIAYAPREEEMFSLTGVENEDELLATHRRAWSGIERLN